MTIEVYKGFNILESTGDHARAGFKYQIDMNPILAGRFFGAYTLEKAKKEIDFFEIVLKENLQSESTPGGGE